MHFGKKNQNLKGNLGLLLTIQEKTSEGMWNKNTFVSELSLGCSEKNEHISSLIFGAGYFYYLSQLEFGFMLLHSKLKKIAHLGSNLRKDLSDCRWGRRKLTNHQSFPSWTLKRNINVVFYTSKFSYRLLHSNKYIEMTSQALSSGWTQIKNGDTGDTA